MSITRILESSEVVCGPVSSHVEKDISERRIGISRLLDKKGDLVMELCSVVKKDGFGPAYEVYELESRLVDIDEKLAGLGIVNS